MESRILMDFVVGEDSAVLELIASEDESHLIGRDAVLVLDLCLDVFNGVRELDLKGGAQTSDMLQEDFSAALDQRDSRILRDFVVGEGSLVLELELATSARTEN